MSVLLLCLLVVTVVRQLWCRSLVFMLPLFIFHYLSLLCLWSHSHIYLLNFSACYLCFLSPYHLSLSSSLQCAWSCFSSHAILSRSLLFSLSLTSLSFLSIFFSFSRSPCESHQREAETEPGVSLMNEVIQAQQTLLCWVTIRLLSPSVSPSVSLSHAHTKWVQSNLTLRTLLALPCNSDVKGFLRTAIKTVPPPYQTSAWI